MYFTLKLKSVCRTTLIKKEFVQKANLVGIRWNAGNILRSYITHGTSRVGDSAIVMSSPRQFFKKCYLNSHSETVPEVEHYKNYTTFTTIHQWLVDNNLVNRNKKIINDGCLKNVMAPQIFIVIIFSITVHNFTTYIFFQFIFG